MLLRLNLAMQDLEYRFDVSKQFLIVWPKREQLYSHSANLISKVLQNQGGSYNLRLRNFC